MVYTREKLVIWFDYSIAMNYANYEESSKSTEWIVFIEQSNENLSWQIFQFLNR